MALLRLDKVGQHLIKEQSSPTQLLLNYFAWGVLFCWSSSSIAQNLTKEKHLELAFGYAIIKEKLPEGYSYSPLFLTARLPILQFSSKKKAAFQLFVEPQFALDYPAQPFKKAIEFGLNPGLQYFFPFSSKSGVAASVGIGPHYLSLATELQAKGFIFSDNFEIGYYQQLGERLGFSIKSRFRHLSNAGLKEPNIGIDNFFLMLGIFWRNRKID